MVSLDVLDLDTVELQAEVVKLREHNRKLAAVIRLLVALLKAFGLRLDQQRLPEGRPKAILLRAIERTQNVLSLRGALKILRLSPARYHQWRRNEQGCGLDDQSSCPRSTPNQLTSEELRTVRTMVESEEYKHVPRVGSACSLRDGGRCSRLRPTWCPRLAASTNECTSIETGDGTSRFETRRDLERRYERHSPNRCD
ncbi:MAG: hypothetical protein ACREXS_09010 [Gammaproteobacteria bacterium]